MKTMTNTPERQIGQVLPFDGSAILYCQVVVALRREGASIRTIAKFSGCGKSTMARLLPKIELLSQMGQLDPGRAAEPGLLRNDLSQMGQLPGGPAS
jgi:hypothetical protein